MLIPVIHLPWVQRKVATLPMSHGSKGCLCPTILQMTFSSSSLVLTPGSKNTTEHGTNSMEKFHLIVYITQFMTNFFHISIICLSVDYTGNNRVGIDSSGLKILSVVSDGKLTSRFTKPLNWTVFVKSKIYNCYL